MLAGKKIAAVVLAYNAEKTLGRTIRAIPPNVVDELIIVDDASSDGTSEVAKNFKSTIILTHKQNLGYGRAQKTGYKEALARQADVIVMLHGDFQYDPSLLPDMALPLAENKADACFGSRMQSKRKAWKDGMPWWRFVANISLSFLEESIFHLHLSEYHTGYRAYRRTLLEKIPFEKNSDDFVFDTEIFAQISVGNFRTTEVSIPTRYFAEAHSINFRRSVVYGLETLGVLGKYILHRTGIKKYEQFLIKK